MHISPTFREKWKKCWLDPVYFSEAYLGVNLHEGQKRWLSNSTQAENVLHAGNRWGKSLIQAVKFLHRLIFQIRRDPKITDQRYTAVNVSITQNQANLVFNHVLRLIRQRPGLGHLIADLRFTPFPQLELKNGSLFSARSSQRRGEYLLGEDYDYVNFDEVAFEPHPDYVVQEVLMLRLADRNGTLDYTSTPKGKNWFYRKCMELERNPNRGYAQTGDSRENPFISQEYLQAKLTTLSPARVLQNIGGQFVEDDNSIVKQDEISAALERSTGLKPPQPDRLGESSLRRYTHGWDLARKRSFTVGITLDVTEKPYQLVAFERFHERPWAAVYAAIRERQKTYGGQTVIDSTGLGDLVLEELKDIKAQGFNFGAQGGKAKFDLLLNLKRAHEENLIAYPYLEQIDDSGELWTLPNELSELTWEDNQHCDAAMALALALWGARRKGSEEIFLPFRVGLWK